MHGPRRAGSVRPTGCSRTCAPRPAAPWRTEPPKPSRPSSQNVRTLLQSVVRMRDRAVVGYEALSRGPQGSALEQSDRLFAAAAAGACGRTVDMELHCLALNLGP